MLRVLRNMLIERVVVAILLIGSIIYMASDLARVYGLPIPGIKDAVVQVAAMEAIVMAAFFVTWVWTVKMYVARRNSPDVYADEIIETDHFGAESFLTRCEHHAIGTLG